MKKLYEFSFPKIEEVEEKVASKDASGADIVVLQKVNKEVPQKFYVARPSRALREEADLFRSSVYGMAIAKKMIPLASLQKRYASDGGILADEEKKELDQLQKDIAEWKARHVALQELKERTPEQDKEMEEINQNLKIARDRMINLDMIQVSAYHYTPEVFARNKTALWYLLFTLFKENGEPVFKGSSYEQKLASYDEIEESDDPFLNKVISRGMSIVTLWMMSGIDKQEEFEKVFAEE